MTHKSRLRACMQTAGRINRSKNLNLRPPSWHGRKHDHDRPNHQQEYQSQRPLSPPARSLGPENMSSQQVGASPSYSIVDRGAYLVGFERLYPARHAPSFGGRSPRAKSDGMSPAKPLKPFYNNELGHDNASSVKASHRRGGPNSAARSCVTPRARSPSVRWFSHRRSLR